MEASSVDLVREQSEQILREWLESCTRHGKIARNTVAIGIVVLDHLLRVCPVSREDAISQGGEVSGARSGLGKTLESHGIPSSYLKEVTTRQGHQDGQRLFEQFEWGEIFHNLEKTDRQAILQARIQDLKQLANDWLQRQNLKLDIDRRQSPAAWISEIVSNAKGRSGGVVEQQLVGAKLAKRHSSMEIDNHPAHAGDRQTDRTGDFSLQKTVYHVTSAPSRAVLQKCSQNIRAGLLPVLLVPEEQRNRAQILAQDEGIHKDMMIIAIEDFVGVNIVELAAQDNTDAFTVLQDIIELYNRRLAEVETDLSLQIEVR